jgi:hypothetical protein
VTREERTPRLGQTEGRENISSDKPLQLESFQDPLGAIDLCFGQLSIEAPSSAEMTQLRGDLLMACDWIRIKLKEMLKIGREREAICFYSIEYFS